MKKFLCFFLTFLYTLCIVTGCSASPSSGAGAMPSYSVVVYAETLNGEPKNITAQYSDLFGELVGEKGSSVSIREYVVECAPKGYEIDTAKSTIEGTIKADNSLKLTLWYKLRTYTVSFGSYAEAQFVKYGDTATRPTDPTKENFFFEEWTLYNKPFDFSTPIRNDITLIPSFVTSANEMVPGDTYANDVYGACAVDENGEIKNAQQSLEYFEGGLFYLLPEKGMVYDILLPRIDYSKYAQVSFEWRCQEYLGAGTEASSWNSMEVEQSGTITITLTQTGSLSIVMTHPQIGDWPQTTYDRHVTDSNIINGKTALTLYGRTFGSYRWFTISVPQFIPLS